MIRVKLQEMEKTSYDRTQEVQRELNLPDSISFYLIILLYKPPHAVSIH